MPCPTFTLPSLLPGAAFSSPSKTLPSAPTLDSGRRKRILPRSHSPDWPSRIHCWACPASGEQCGCAARRAGWASGWPCGWEEGWENSGSTPRRWNWSVAAAAPCSELVLHRVPPFLPPKRLWIKHRDCHTGNLQEQAEGMTRAGQKSKMPVKQWTLTDGSKNKWVPTLLLRSKRE